MHLGQLANCFEDFNDDRGVLQVQNDCFATVTVLLQQQHRVPRQAQPLLNRTKATKTEPIQSAMTTGEHCKSPR